MRTELLGVGSLRHGHGMRFGQSDIYVVCVMRALDEEIRLDTSELADARWMGRGP